MELKADEFRNLKTILEYTNAFNYLSQYALDEVSFDPKKQNHYFRWLSLRMQDKLSVASCANYNALVSLAIRVESKMLVFDAETCKRAIPSSQSVVVPLLNAHARGNTSTSCVRLWSSTTNVDGAQPRVSRSILSSGGAAS
ncbi:LOW QUALITY PROTEIN: hypothetical protein U9M48_003380 [Paspalum notatum var. saurae]|uniref:Uncharacterized protein n=1 Tax=Paspalum notatum var. saurae TaxID=547442 RepID=A0AAQ3SI56_PASNO